MGKGFAATALVVISLVVAPRLDAQFDAGIPVGSQAPAVAIPDLDGTPFDLGTILGRKPVLIEFWATWCSLCRELLPQLEQIRKTWGDRIELVGINVTVNESKARVRRYLDQHHPPFRVLYDEKGVGARAFDVPGTSFIVVVDKTGKVVYTGTGDRQDLLGAARKALQVP